MVTSQYDFPVGAEELPRSSTNLIQGRTLSLYCMSCCDKVWLAFGSVGGDTFSLGLTVAAQFRAETV